MWIIFLPITGLYSLSGKISYPQISQCLKKLRFGVKTIASLWNWTTEIHISWLWHFARSSVKMSHHWVNRGPGVWNKNTTSRIFYICIFVVYITIPHNNEYSSFKIRMTADLLVNFQSKLKMFFLFFLSNFTGPHYQHTCNMLCHNQNNNMIILPVPLYNSQAIAVLGLTHWDLVTTYSIMDVA